MLPDLPHVREILAGPDGLSAGSAMTHLVVMGTVSPQRVRELGEELAAAGVSLVDAPVSGGTKGALAGTLAISAGADEPAFETVRPYLEAMGGLVLRMGPLGAGSLTKACNQLVVAGTVAALAEAVHLGEQGGLNTAALLDILGAGLARSEVLAQKRVHFVTSDFTGGGPADYLLKDLRIVLESGAAATAVLPVAAVITQLCQSVVARGDGRLDSSSLLNLLRQMAAAG
jgi:2-hydroxy-3-oxopropionate reductase